MAKFSSRNIEFKDGQKAIFGSNDDSYLTWDNDGNQLLVSTAVSGVDPTADGHVVTKRHLEAYVDTVSGTIEHSNLLNLDVDDHLQYVPIDGSRGFTSTVSGVDPEEDNDLTTRQYVVGKIDSKPDTFLELEDTPISYDSDKYLRSTAVGVEWAVCDFSSISSENIIYIAKNGNDTTASGTVNDPYLTIKHAMSTVSGSSETNRYVFSVGPGIFHEDNPLHMGVFTQLAGGGSMFSTTIIPNNVNDNLIENNHSTDVSNLWLNGCTGASAVSTTVSGYFSNYSLIITDCKKGLYINNKDAYTRFSDVNYTGNIEDAVLIESGYCSIRGLYSPPNTVITSVIKTNGPDSLAEVSSITSSDSTITNYFYANNQSKIIALGGSVDDCTNVFRLNNGSELIASNIVVGDNTVRQVHIENKNCIIKFIGCIMDAEKMFGPENYEGDSVFFMDSKTNGITAYSDLTVGRPDRSWTTVLGGGRSYNKGMAIFTTDSTTSNISDGGNIIDVTEDAATVSGSSFGFQGVEAGHSILVGAAFTENIKSTGVKFYQLSAAVEITKRSFAVEYWNGTNWVECTVMTTHSEEGYSYANEMFIRADSNEYISYYIKDDWDKKTINGVTTYWVRFKIKHLIITGPVFEWAKLQTNRTKFNNDGYNTFYGKAKFKQTLLAAGNIFGESGGVTSSYTPVGSLTTGWTHYMKNNKLNSNGDAIYLQANLHRGICTAFPLYIKVIGHPTTSMLSSDGVIKISVLPIEVQGVLEADPSGGIIPVERALSNTETMTANSAQVTSVNVPFTEGNKLITVVSDEVDISNYYEGDMVGIRIELDDDGSGNKDFSVWTVEILGVKWTHGEKI